MRIRATAVVIIYQFVSGHVTAPSRINILLLLAGKRACTHITHNVMRTHENSLQRRDGFCRCWMTGLPPVCERVRISEKHIIILFLHTHYTYIYYNAYTCARARVCVYNIITTTGFRTDSDGGGLPGECGRRRERENRLRRRGDTTRRRVSTEKIK